MQGKLYQHCAEVENQAKAMFDMLVEQMKETEGISENLKDRLRGAVIHTEIFGSDHCPVELTIE